VNREVGFDIYIAERTMLDISLLLFYFKHVLVYFFIYTHRLFSLFSELHCCHESLILGISMPVDSALWFLSLITQNYIKDESLLKLFNRV